MGLLILYVLACAFLVGIALETFMGKMLPGKEVTGLFNGLILYYFSIDFLMRLQLQELPTLSIVPYLHLNIRRAQLVNFLNIRALFSAFNLLPILLFFPFCLLRIQDTFGTPVCAIYIVSILSLTLFNNYLVLYVKRLSAASSRFVFTGLILLLLAGALEYFKVLSIGDLSNKLFSFIALHPLAGLIFPLLAGLTFRINSIYLRNNLYLEELRSGEKKKSATDYPFLNQFGEVGTLAALEIKMILRNKRSKSTVSKGIIFVFYGLLFYKADLLAHNNFGLMLFAAVFMTGNIILIYGQFMFGWQSAEFDGLMANKTNIRNFIKAKFLLFTLSSTLLTLVISLYGLISWKILIIQLAAYLYSIGIATVIVLYFATWNYKYIDLSKGSSFNWQGVGASSMLMSLPVILFPCVVYLPFHFQGSPYLGLGVVGALGLAGFLTRNFWVELLVKEFNKRKYKIAAGFRELYAGRTVVQIEHLEVKAGETIGLVGNNGAGKTTLFRMLLDLIRPDAGEIQSKGIPVAGADQWKDYTASYLDEGFLIDYLTPEEYFVFIGSLRQMSPAHVADYLRRYEEFFNDEILNRGKYIRDFSKGNQNKIGIAAAIMQNPELLILDEPFANLDPTTQIRLKNLIKNLKKEQNLATLISSHDLNHVTDVSDRIILMEKGQIIKDLYKDENTLKDLEAYFSE
eukprot:gene13131-15439_t